MWIQLIPVNSTFYPSPPSWTDERTKGVFAKNIYRVILREGRGNLSCYISKWMIMTFRRREHVDGINGSNGRLFTRIYAQTCDRICTRACVCVNTFVRLSPFACPTCKYTRRAHVGTHRVSRGLHPHELHAGMFYAVSVVLPIIIIRIVASTVVTQSTPKPPVAVKSGKRKQFRLTEPQRTRILFFCQSQVDLSSSIGTFNSFNSERALI